MSEDEGSWGGAVAVFPLGFSVDCSESVTQLLWPPVCVGQQQASPLSLAHSVTHSPTHSHPPALSLRMKGEEICLFKHLPKPQLIQSCYKGIWICMGPCLGLGKIEIVCVADFFVCGLFSVILLWKECVCLKKKEKKKQHS